MNFIQTSQKALRVTLSQPLLWLFGILLSSGFNLHTWYSLQLFLKFEFVQKPVSVLLSSPWPYRYSIMLIGLVIVVIGVNILKLLFLTQLHSLLHQHGECPLCERVKEKTLTQIIFENKVVLWRAILASLFTLVSTVGLLLVYKFYSAHGEESTFKSIILMLSLFGLSILVSLWNLFTVMFAFWYRFSFARSANLSLELIFSRIGIWVKYSLLATACFLIWIALGGLVLFQAKAVNLSWLNLALGQDATQALQVLTMVGGVAFFILWLIIGNVWFNVVMVMVFDKLVRMDSWKSAQTEPSASSLLVS